MSSASKRLPVFLSTIAFLAAASLPVAFAKHDCKCEHKTESCSCHDGECADGKCKHEGHADHAKPAAPKAEKKK